MSSRFITLLWLLCAALGGIGADTRAPAIAERVAALTSDIARSAETRSAMHAGEITSNDFVQRDHVATHARTHPGFSKRSILAEDNRRLLGFAHEIVPSRTAATPLRPPLAANQARAPPV